ncbi:MAG TPA: BON domain-containing protein, partial [Gemmatimonadaceae bacterium]|nr:BON domain-containing protein [Gemmatimonadaceae bacterium]
NLDDLAEMDDDELRELVRERLDDVGGLDVDNVTVRVEGGVVHLVGRVGTDAELRIAEHVVTDRLGISQVENELVVDELRRSENPDDPEEAEDLADSESGMVGWSPPEPYEDTAAHLEEDLDARLYGTADVQEAIGEGTSYEPPDGPTPEGFETYEEPDEHKGEQH